MLREKVRDTVTGVTGIAVARIEYMNGCVQYLIQPKVVKDGVPAKPEWYDTQQVELVGVRKTAKAKQEEEDPGGPPPKSTPHFGK